MNVSEIRAPADVRLLAKEWRRLADSAPSASVFQDPDWVLPWLEYFGAERRLRVFAVFEHGELRAVLPLMEGERGGLVPIGSPLNDRNELLTTEGERPRAWQALWSACGPVLRMTVTHMPEHDLEACAAAAPGAVTRLDGEPSPLVRLPDDWSGYCAQLPNSRRKRWAADFARLQRQGEVRFEALDGARLGASDLLDFWERRMLQWRSAGRLDELDWLQRSERFPRFLLESGLALATRGRLALTRVCLGERRIASGLYLLEDGRALDYMRTYDRRLRACSPGTVCTLFGIRHFLERRIRIYDFGRGDEAYKFKFLAEPFQLAGVKT